MAVFDLPARAGATNYCLYCIAKGVHDMHTQVFFLDEQHESRSSTTIEQHARHWRCRSVLSSTLDLVQAVPVDYMHAILEAACLDSKYRSSRYYPQKLIKG